VKHFNNGDKYERDKSAAERSQLSDGTTIEQMRASAFTTQNRRHADTDERETECHYNRRHHLKKSHTYISSTLRISEKEK